jgi:hypothetical protein
VSNNVIFIFWYLASTKRLSPLHPTELIHAFAVKQHKS